MSSTPFAAEDITAVFPENAGALELRELNLGGDIGADEIVTSLLYNFAPDADRDIVGIVGSQPGLWSLYYGFYLLNKHPDQTVTDVKIWIYRAMSDPNLAVSIGFDPVGKNGVAQTIPDQLTAPTGVTFKSPFTEVSTTVLTIPVFSPGDKQFVWVRTFGNKGIASISQASYGIKWSFQRPAETQPTP